MSSETGWVVFTDVSEFNSVHDAAKLSHRPPTPYQSVNALTGLPEGSIVAQLAVSYMNDADVRVTAFIYEHWPDDQRAGFIYQTREEVYADGFTSVGNND